MAAKKMPMKKMPMKPMMGYARGGTLKVKGKKDNPKDSPAKERAERKKGIKT